MVISSLLLEIMPEYEASILEELATYAGVEVHGVKNNQIVVTIEAETVDDSHETASKFIVISGVTGVNLVYANFEDDPSLKG